MDIKGEYQITTSEYRQCTFYTMNKLNRGWRFLTDGYIVIASLYFTLIYVDSLKADPLTVFLFAAGGFFLLSRVLLINSRILAYAKRPDSMIGAVHYLIMDDDRLYISIPRLKKRGESNYSQIYKAFEITANFIIYTDPKTCFILPKRVLKEETILKLREKLSEAMGTDFESKYIHKSFSDLWQSLFQAGKKGRLSTNRQQTV